MWSFFIVFGSNYNLFTSFDNQHPFGLTFSTLNPQCYFLSSLSLLSENRFSLSSISWLLSIISSFSLSSSRILTFLVLPYLMVCMLHTFLTMSLSCFRNYYHFNILISFIIYIQIYTNRVIDYIMEYKW